MGANSPPVEVPALMIVRIAIGEHGEPIGEAHPRARYSDATVRLVRDAHELGGETTRQIATRLGLPLRWVDSVAYYERRVTLPANYRVTTRAENYRIGQLP